jgi:copper chaperone NosL
MIISDPKFAAATLMTNGETHKFDDIGDMVVYHAQYSELQVKAWFVHDYPTQAWIRAEDAFFVVSREKLITPMGRGVAAFAVPSAAEVFAKNLGVLVLTFEELKKGIK